MKDPTQTKVDKNARNVFCQRRTREDYYGNRKSPTGGRGEEGRDKGSRSSRPKPALQKTGQIRQEKIMDM